MVIRLAALVAVAVLAGLSLDRVYDGSLLSFLVAGAALGAAGVSVALRRAATWSVGPVSVVAMVGYVLVAAAVSAARADVPGPLVEITGDALANGAPRMLTAMIPVTPQPDTVVIPVMATWLAALVGSELAIRGGRTLLSAVPALALFGGALYLVGPNAAPAMPLTVAVVGVLGLNVALAGVASGHATVGGGPAAGDVRVAGDGGSGLLRAARQRAGWGRLVAAGAALGAAAAVAVPAAGLVDNRPGDPRRHVTPPRLDALEANPLVRLSGWALRPEQSLFEVRLTGGADAPNRLRLATLSRYDGVTWQLGATFRTAGRALPPPADEVSDPTGAVAQEFTITGLDGRLLPAAAAPRSVEGVRVAFDPDGGALLCPEPLSPGVRYTARSAVRPVPAGLLPDAAVPQDERAAALMTVGDGAPAELTELADRIGADAVTAYERATALERHLSGRYRLAADAPSGHAYPNLSFFLFGPAHAGGRRGASEQFAAAFAVLARLMGLPTRVVVGFRVPAGGGPVRGADAVAWPEVLFDGVGWTPFDPLPRADQPPRRPESDIRPRPEPTTPPPSAPPSPAEPPQPTPGAPPATAAAPAGDGVPTGALAAPLAVAALAVAAGASMVARRRLTRRRLGTADPRARVAGAWQELHDALRLSGRAPAPHLTATAVAELTACAGGPAVTRLADAANLVAFAPPGSGAVSAPDADIAVAQAVGHVAWARSQLSWWRRWWWTIHPGPLRWRQSGVDRQPHRDGGARAER
ncbi:DUF3488 and transglutaminase-like domain-containing protein [Pilimelia columellifera]|uniref:Transglutaminase-like domain-containing protein n=1 Tax=Pilimelia columellifera subsp. columellifera TaxID=706583 RepID=A0ABP6ATF9_9ACTN